MVLGQGGSVYKPHRAIVLDAYLSRYGWSWEVHQHTPAFILDELGMVISGIAEGEAKRRATSSQGGYAGHTIMDPRSASEVARAGGLPSPPEGWPDIHPEP